MRRHSATFSRRSPLEVLASLRLSNVAFIDASGDGGGTVTIRGGRLVVDGSFIFADTLGDMPGARRGIDIAVAQEVRLRQGSFLTTDVFGAGAGGDIQRDRRLAHPHRGRPNLQLDLWSRPGWRHHPHRHRRPHPGRHRPGGRFPSGIVAQAQGVDANAGRGGRHPGHCRRARPHGGCADLQLDLWPGHGGSPSPAYRRPHPGRHSPRAGLPSGIFAQAQGTDANAGAAGAIQVTAASLTLTEDARISSSTLGPGRGGTITLTVTMLLALTAGRP